MARKHVMITQLLECQKRAFLHWYKPEAPYPHQNASKPAWSRWLTCHN